MVTIYRITIDTNGVITSKVPVYQGEELAEIHRHLGGDHYNRANYKIVPYSGNLLQDNQFPKVVTDTTLIDLSLLARGQDDDEDAEHLLVIGPYQDHNQFENFLFNRPRSQRVWIPRKEKSVDFWKFISQPGTWTLVTLALILAGIFVPVAAPGLILVATITLGLAAISLIPYIKRYVEGLWRNPEYENTPHTFEGFLEASFDNLQNWAKSHPMQATIVGICVALLITAVVLTIGFFTGGGAIALVGGALVATGGASFAFMAPVFAAIATPFAVAAAAVGAQVSLAALAVATLILTTLCVPDVLRRIADFLEGCVADLYGPQPKAIAVNENNTQSLTQPLIEQPTTLVRIDEAKSIGNPFVYFGKLFKGIGIKTGLADSQYCEARDKYLLNNKNLSDEVEMTGNKLKSD